MDDPRYERLARHAREHGYPRCKAAAVHTWVTRGIFPEALIEHVDWARRVITEPEHAFDQLLAICEYRYRHKPVSVEAIGVWLWLDGYEVEARAVRRGLMRLADLPEWASRIARGQVNYDGIAKTLIAGFEEPHASAADLAVGLADTMALLGGSMSLEDADQAGLAEVAELAGLGRLARDFGHDRSDLEVPLAAIVGVSSVLLDRKRLSGLIDAATPRELEDAKRLAIQVAAAWVDASGATSKVGHARFAGLDVLGTRLGQTQIRALAVLASLVDPTGVEALLGWLGRTAQEWSAGAPLSAAVARPPRPKGR